jgi:hypothetical protein
MQRTPYLAYNLQLHLKMIARRSVRWIVKGLLELVFYRIFQPVCSSQCMQDAPKIMCIKVGSKVWLQCGHKISAIFTFSKNVCLLLYRYFYPLFTSSKTLLNGSYKYFHSTKRFHFWTNISFSHLSGLSPKTYPEINFWINFWTKITLSGPNA